MRTASSERKTKHILVGPSLYPCILHSISYLHSIWGFFHTMCCFISFHSFLCCSPLKAISTEAVRRERYGDLLALPLGHRGQSPCYWGSFAISSAMFAIILLLRGSRGVWPFGISAPHWKKKSCLGPHIKYIATCNHKIHLIMFWVNLRFCVGPHS